jgi:hypothetical protein
MMLNKSFIYSSKHWFCIQAETLRDRQTDLTVSAKQRTTSRVAIEITPLQLVRC